MPRMTYNESFPILNETYRADPHMELPQSNAMAVICEYANFYAALLDAPYQVYDELMKEARRQQKYLPAAFKQLGRKTSKHLAPMGHNVVRTVTVSIGVRRNQHYIANTDVLHTRGIYTPSQVISIFGGWKVGTDDIQCKACRQIADKYTEQMEASLRAYTNSRATEDEKRNLEMRTAEEAAKKDEKLRMLDALEKMGNPADYNDFNLHNLPPLAEFDDGFVSSKGDVQIGGIETNVQVGDGVQELINDIQSNRGKTAK